MREIIDINNWNRKLAYNTFLNYDDPYTGIVTTLNVTNLVNICDNLKCSFYGPMVYMIMHSMNNIDAYKYGFATINNEQFVCKYSDLAATMTVINQNNELHFTRYVKYNEDFKEFITKFKNAINDAVNGIEYYKIKDLDGCNKIHITCMPWIKFTNFKDAVNLKEKNSKPKICWYKFEQIEDEYYVNFSILVNHAFQDGYHIGLFINNLQDNINNLTMKEGKKGGIQYAKRKEIY